METGNEGRAASKSVGAPEEIKKLEERLAGLSLHAVFAGVPLRVLDKHYHASGRPRVPHGSRSYPYLLREAIVDLQETAIEYGFAAENVRAWGPIPLPLAIAVCERLLKGDVVPLTD